MDILSNLLWTLNFLTVIYKVDGYPNGDFPEACESMFVNHEFRGVTVEPQTIVSPFKAEAVITGPDQITVTLWSETPFRGFMLEARDETDSIVGNFVILDPEQTRLLDCNGLKGSAASQKLNTQKNLFRVDWTSNTNNLDVTFKVTFVQDFYTFWKPINNITPSVQPSTTPGTTNPTDTTVATVLTTTESTTEEQTSSTVVSTTRPHATDALSPMVTASVNPPIVPPRIEMCTLAEVFLGTFTITLPSVVASNANNHKKMKWIRRCGSILTLALELTASVLLFFYDKLLKMILIALFMSVTGGVTLGFAFWDVRRSHELWPLYDNVIDVLFLIQNVLAIAFMYCATSHCQPWLLYVLISFTVWVLLQITCIFTLKILKATGSRNKNKKGTDNTEKCLWIGVTVSTVLNVGFCAAIIVGICQC